MAHHTPAGHMRRRPNRASGNGFTGCCVTLTWIIMYLTGALGRIFNKQLYDFGTKEYVIIAILVTAPIIIGAVVYKTLKKALTDRHGEEEGLKKLKSIDNIFNIVSLVLFAAILFIAMKIVRDGF